MKKKHRLRNNTSPKPANNHAKGMNLIVKVCNILFLIFIKLINYSGFYFTIGNIK